jgi:hypothetical protein
MIISTCQWRNTPSSAQLTRGQLSFPFASNARPNTPSAPVDTTQDQPDLPINRFTLALGGGYKPPQSASLHSNAAVPPSPNNPQSTDKIRPSSPPARHHVSPLSNKPNHFNPKRHVQTHLYPFRFCLRSILRCHCSLIIFHWWFHI